MNLDVFATISSRNIKNITHVKFAECKFKYQIIYPSAKTSIGTCRKLMYYIFVLYMY